MLRTRSAPCRASVSASPVSSRTWAGPPPAALPATGATPRWSIWWRTKSMLATMYASGLLISCATPAASVPTAAIRPAKISWFSIRLRSDRSRMKK